MWLQVCADMLEKSLTSRSTGQLLSDSLRRILDGIRFPGKHTCVSCFNLPTNRGQQITRQSARSPYWGSNILYNVHGEMTTSLQHQL